MESNQESQLTEGEVKDLLNECGVTIEDLSQIDPCEFLKLYDAVTTTNHDHQVPADVHNNNNNLQPNGMSHGQCHASDIENSLTDIMDMISAGAERISLTSHLPNNGDTSQHNLSHTNTEVHGNLPQEINIPSEASPSPDNINQKPDQYSAFVSNTLPNDEELFYHQPSSISEVLYEPTKPQGCNVVNDVSHLPSDVLQIPDTLSSSVSSVLSSSDNSSDSLSSTESQSCDVLCGASTSRGEDAGGCAESNARPLSSHVDQSDNASSSKGSLDATIDRETANNTTKRKRGLKGKTSEPSKKEVVCNLASETAMRIDVFYLDIPVETKQVENPHGCVIHPDGGVDNCVDLLHLPQLDYLLEKRKTTIRSDNTKKTITKALKNLENGLHLELNKKGLYATRRCAAHIYWTSTEIDKHTEAHKLERDVQTLVFNVEEYVKSFEKNVSMNNSTDLSKPPLVWFVFAQKWRRDICPLKSMAISATVAPARLNQWANWYFHTEPANAKSLTESFLAISDV